MAQSVVCEQPVAQKNNPVKAGRSQVHAGVRVLY